MKISSIVQALETLAPTALQEDYDNSGLQLGNIDNECSGVLISLDATETVVREAVEKKCNLVVSHHPLIFRGVKRIDPGVEPGRTIFAAIQHGIAIYAIHTNLDNVLPGVNSTMADRLGLVNRRFLSPRLPAERPGERPAGSGLLGELPQPLAETAFLDLLRERFNLVLIRHSALTGRPVQRVALCGGAGSFLIPNALLERADFFVSGDISYHRFFEAGERMVIADIGHYESEQFSVDLLHDLLVEKFPTFAVLKAGKPTNPVHYYK
ncbi:MAG TPA: Nif3-like dinuclear metal center hexameric protein [Puia sp.]|nr:Nif3-like dinuclear metal center hexameric protein [Puia sp.]